MQMKTAAETLPAMKANLTAKQVRVQDAERAVFNLKDALSAAGTMQAKAQDVNAWEPLHFSMKTTLSLLATALESAMELVTERNKEAREQYDRIVAMELLV